MCLVDPCESRARRSRSSATPTTSPSTAGRPIAAAGVNRVSLGVQSMSAHVLASLGRTHDQANVERAVAAIVDPVCRRSISISSTARPVSPRRLALDRRGGVGVRSTAHLRVRADGGSRHTVGVAARSTSRRRRPGRQVRTRRRPARRQPDWSTTRCRTGPGPVTSPVTTSSTGTRPTTAASAVRRTHTSRVAGGGTCAHPIGTSRWSAVARPPRRRRRRSMPRRAASKACNSRFVPVMG